MAKNTRPAEPYLAGRVLYFIGYSGYIKLLK